MAKRKRVKYSKFRSWYNFHKQKKPAPSGLIITFGARGCGKSATIAKRYLKWLRKEKKIYGNFYSNIEFNIRDNNSHYLDLTNHKITDYFDPNDEIIKRYKISTYDPVNPVPYFISRDCIICLDELGIIAHSRDYSNFPKQFISLIKVLRKLGILMLANSQNYDIDKQLRLGASDLRLQKKIINLSYSRKIKKWIDISKDAQSAESQIVDQVDFASIFEKDALQFTYIPYYAGLYNSFI